MTAYLNRFFFLCNRKIPFKHSHVFFPQGRMSLSGMLISRIEDGETLRNAFEISGALFIQTTGGFTCSAPLFKSTSVSELSLKMWRGF